MKQVYSALSSFLCTPLGLAWLYGYFTDLDTRILLFHCMLSKDRSYPLFIFSRQNDLNLRQPCYGFTYTFFMSYCIAFSFLLAMLVMVGMKLETKKTLSDGASLRVRMVLTNVKNYSKLGEKNFKHISNGLTL